MTKCLGENNFWDWQNQILALIHFWTRLIFWNSRTTHPIFMKTFFYMGYYINFTRFTGISDPIVHLFYRGRILLFVRVSRIRQIWMLQTQILITSLNTLYSIHSIFPIYPYTHPLLYRTYNIILNPPTRLWTDSELKPRKLRKKHQKRL